MSFLCALSLLAGVVGVVIVSRQTARAATPEKLLGRPGAGEFQPVRGDGFIAWQQNTRRDPDEFDVYARALGRTGTFRVNPATANGANGDIDGDVLVFQQFGIASSRLKLFDLSRRRDSNLPSAANSPEWEYWPSISGNNVLFGRLYDSGLRRIFLLDLSANTVRRLDRSRVPGDFVDLAPGQVNGDWAVWHKCRSETDCDVIRYNIADADRDTIPNRGGRQYSPAVSSTGTVFYARSRARCGSGVRLVSRPVDGRPVTLTNLPSGDDVSAMDAYTDPEGRTTVLFDQFDCARAAVSDAWEIAEDLTPQLTVKVEGDAAGTVTSSPAGINCGSDCSEIYEFGTGVTLTATPSGGAAFAGWSGACTGSSSTCTLEMNGPKSVTATFTNKPVLTVSKSGTGTGTVTSSPSGINCGTDCSEPYNEGTSVTLTASAAANSTFAGWTAACSGSGLTCNVTMNVSKEAIATFTLKPQHMLTVDTDGAGRVTGPGIDCGTDGVNTFNDCDEQYDEGTPVTLTADPVEPLADTVTWAGGCSGSELSCQLTMDGPKLASATFSLSPP
jgi:hypothetical protein